MGRSKIQPARKHLAAQRWSDPAAAKMIGVRRTHFKAAILGCVRPCQAIRERLPILLGVPIEELFEADRLDAPFLGDLGIGNTSADPLSWDVPSFPPLGGAK